MLEFKGKQAIAFKDLKVVPQSTTELRLRLRNVDFTTDEKTKEAIEVMSSFFPDKKTEVKQFMTDEMEVYELSQLQAYLAGGQVALDLVEKQMERAMVDAVEEANV